MSGFIAEPVSRARKRVSLTGLVAVGLLMTVCITDARAETTFSITTGPAWTADSDVRLQEPGGTDLNYQDVSWSTKPFEMPSYYGFRTTHWLDRYPGWGVALDFTHAKMYSDLEQVVPVTGARAGAPVAGPERLGDSYSALEFTDGHNLLTLNAVRRWRAGDQAHVYLGAGAGVAVPHTEGTALSSLTEEYQLAGPAAQFMAGATLPLGNRFALIAEYRLTWAQLESELNGGGSLSTEALTHHLNLGIGFSF
jgi:lipid A oxidase